MNADPAAYGSGPASGGHEQISAQVHSVIAAAERAAEAIREDAETQAQIHLGDAQDRAHQLLAQRLQLIGELTDDLLAHAAVVREQSATLLATLEQAIAVAEARLAEAPQQPQEPAPEPSAEPAAVLRATQLAVAGESRESIAATLGEEFGIDPDPVLAQVLGPA